MKRHQFLFGGAIFVTVLSVGAGCTNLTNLTNNIQEATQDVAAGKMSETEYYNLVIQHMNTIADNVQIMDERALGAMEAEGAENKAVQYYKYDYLSGTMTDDARKALLEASISMENADAQKNIEGKVDPYFTKVNEAGALYDQLAEYAEREQYKDDAGAKFTELEPQLKTKLEEIIPLQTDIFDTVEEYQNGVDLNIDENTSDPLEVIVLTQETLSDDVEAAHELYLTWADAYIAGTTNEAGEMQAAFDTLSADYDKYKAKLDETNAADALNINIHLTGYMNAVDEYSILYEKTIRNINNKELEDIVDLDKKLSDQYGEVIDEHNSLVSDVNSASNFQ